MDTDTQFPSQHPQPMRGPFSRWPRTSDMVLACLLLVWSIFVTDAVGNQNLSLRPFTSVPLLQLCTYALACMSLYWRRCYPLAVLGVNLAALSLFTIADVPNSVWSMPIAVYSAGRYATSEPYGYLTLIGAIACSVITSLAKGEPTSSTLLTFIIVSLIWYFGRYFGVRREYMALLEKRAEEVAHEQAARAQRAVTAERHRIARELHDVVAHRVSLMTVQAGAANTVANTNPSQALEAMRAVEDAGRLALDELRHLLGVLRPDQEDGALSPQPGIRDLPELIQEFKSAGMDVTLMMENGLAEFSALIDLSAYRIVQESLTNVLKHAESSAQTSVQIEKDKDHLVIVVQNTGSNVFSEPGQGHGINGMKERASLLAGTLDAEPLANGGFKVTATLPIIEGVT